MLGNAKSKARHNKAVEKFLGENPLAKIVIILDTHSAQDGQIIAKMEGEYTYTDTLGKVSQCIPRPQADE